MGCIVRNGSSRYLYYLGWNLGVTVPWRNAIGLAISPDGDSRFEKVSRAPVVDRNETDPFSISYPWVMHEGGRWRMWYGSNLDWGAGVQADMAFVVKYGESDDGVHWRRDGVIAIGHNSPGEYAIARPCVLKDEARYRMWYSHRGPAYRIGYAESDDGIRWGRMDEDVGIDVSASGWDCESIEYAYVFRHRQRLYMLYNGNGYGKTGFGLAICTSERE
jgi:hypothetical protein